MEIIYKGGGHSGSVNNLNDEIYSSIVDANKNVCFDTIIDEKKSGILEIKWSFFLDKGNRRFEMSSFTSYEVNGDNTPPDEFQLNNAINFTLGRLRTTLTEQGLGHHFECKISDSELILYRNDLRDAVIKVFKLIPVAANIYLLH